MYTREDHMSISKVIAFKYFVVKCVCYISSEQLEPWLVAIIIITGSVRRTQQTHTPRNAVYGDHPFTHSLALKGVNHSTSLVFSQAAAGSSVSQSIIQTMNQTWKKRNAQYIKKEAYSSPRQADNM